jgi:uncharacterized protein
MATPVTRGSGLAALIAVGALLSGWTALSAQSQLPELRAPVNDFAGVMDERSTQDADRLIRTLQSRTGDVIVIATVETVEPFADAKEYAVKLFENHGRGIGERSKDNGLLVLLAMRERRVQVEVGYGLEPFVTDGFAGETSRTVMSPYFRQGEYGRGLVAGVERFAARIAQGRGVDIGVPPDRTPVPRARPGISSGGVVALIVLLLIGMQVIGAISRFNHRRRRRWGRPRTWSGWHSGVGPFGGSGGFGGFGGFGGGGGGFGGFGGGRSGGGGGGASW